MYFIIVMTKYVVNMQNVVYVIYNREREVYQKA